MADGARRATLGWDGPALRRAPVIGDPEFDRLVNSAHQHDTPPPCLLSASGNYKWGVRSLESCADELFLVSNEEDAHGE